MEVNKPFQKVQYARPNYYQGILQLRNVNDEVLSFGRNKIDKREDAAITKIVKQPDGVDFYITSQKFIRILGKKLQEDFGGELNLSSSLHTKSKTGKDLYRINALFRMAKFRTGAEITTRSGDVVRITHIGRKIFAKDLNSGKRVIIKKSDLPLE